MTMTMIDAPVPRAARAAHRRPAPPPRSRKHRSDPGHDLTGELGRPRLGQERLAHFNRLFAERYRSMVGLAIGLIDQPPVAEEIVQEAFQRVWTRWDSLERPTVYLRTAVVNGCHDELRRRRVRRKTDPTLRPPVPAESHYLVDALSTVDAKRREALILRYYGGRTVPEVAKAMGIPTGTAKSLIHRGLADLRTTLR